MPALREVPPPAAVNIAERLSRDTRQRDVIDRRLSQLEHDRDQLFRATRACRQAVDHLPDGDNREALEDRIRAIHSDLDLRPLAALRALHQDAA